MLDSYRFLQIKLKWQLSRFLLVIHHKKIFPLKCFILVLYMALYIFICIYSGLWTRDVFTIKYFSRKPTFQEVIYVLTSCPTSEALHLFPSPTWPDSDALVSCNSQVKYVSGTASAEWGRALGDNTSSLEFKHLQSQPERQLSILLNRKKQRLSWNSGGHYLFSCGNSTFRN